MNKTGGKSKGKRQITGQEDPCVVRDDIPGTAAISSKSSLGVPLWPEGHREVHMDQAEFPWRLIRRSFGAGHIQILLCQTGKIDGGHRRPSCPSNYSHR